VAAGESPDAAIVDLVLPDGNGIELCRELRAWSTMPIVVLLALDEEEQKVLALQAGADDYLTNSFSARETGPEIADQDRAGCGLSLWRLSTRVCSRRAAGACTLDEIVPRRLAAAGAWPVSFGSVSREAWSAQCACPIRDAPPPTYSQPVLALHAPARRRG
jgi:CheY-like chemotaxis protein